MKSRDPNEKEVARERKEDRKEQAEQIKQDARDQNATARQAGAGYTTGGYYRGNVNRGYTTTTTSAGTAYDAGSGRQAGYDDNIKYAGDAAGGYAYSTTGRRLQKWGLPE
ncbi:hypothetical protein PTKIN_Ptkin06aG0082400 [Pterospermum kingtungense]